MRLAVFTNEFPGRPVTFFSRDMRALAEEGFELDIFPFYPLDAALWGDVPDALSERVLPHERVHHISPFAALRSRRVGGLGRLPAFLRDVGRIESSALRYGVRAAAKAGYVALKAWAWAERCSSPYDHVLAYWGSYAACCAYLFHRLTDPRVPFSMFVRARADLYEQPVGLARNMLYADNIFLVCEFNRGYIRDRYRTIFPQVAAKIHLHPTGLDLREVPFTPSPRAPATLLAVGRLEKLKGFDRLLQAVAELGRRGVDVRLELIGGGVEEPRLRKLAKKLGVAARVDFRGWLASDAVLRAMRQATLLVHPAVDLDAMPNVVKEALAVGTPVVASDMAGIPEMLDGGRGGRLVPPGDVSALVDAIEQLLADPARRQAYAVVGREQVERHYDVWRNGKRLAERLRSTRRDPRP